MTAKELITALDKVPPETEILVDFPAIRVVMGNHSMRLHEDDELASFTLSGHLYYNSMENTFSLAASREAKYDHT